VRTCIYCLASGPNIVFNREHVMPEAFGMFEQNLTLLNEVCQDCNTAMGKDVETPGNRGSIEGVHRFKTGELTTAKRFLKTPRNRVTFEIGEPGWEGVQAYFELSRDGKGAKVMFAPQVVVDFKEGPSKSFLMENLTDAAALTNALTYRAYVDSDEQLAALIDALNRLGITPKWTNEIEMPESEDSKAEVKVSAIYDDVVRRLMAKIAFNYLAHIAGARFVVNPDFDPVRRFIRYGEGRGADFVTPTHDPLLHEEQDSGGWTITEDHLVAIQRDDAGGLFGRVSLFNMIQNVIVLCPHRSELVYLGAIPSGRRFSWNTGKISTLEGVDHWRLVQPGRKT
jgi:HNH endonuclease